MNDLERPSVPPTETTGNVSKAIEESLDLETPAMFDTINPLKEATTDELDRAFEIEPTTENLGSAETRDVGQIILKAAKKIIDGQAAMSRGEMTPEDMARRLKEIEAIAVANLVAEGSLTLSSEEAKRLLQKELPQYLKAYREIHLMQQSAGALRTAAKQETDAEAKG